MSVIRVGSTSSYADGWDQIFLGSKATKAAGKKSMSHTSAVKKATGKVAKGKVATAKKPKSKKPTSKKSVTATPASKKAGYKPALKKAKPRQR